MTWYIENGTRVSRIWSVYCNKKQLNLRDQHLIPNPLCQVGWIVVYPTYSGGSVDCLLVFTCHYPPPLRRATRIPLRVGWQVEYLWQENLWRLAWTPLCFGLLPPQHHLTIVEQQGHMYAAIRTINVFCTFTVSKSEWIGVKNVCKQFQYIINSI